jgi:hypothetical protein
VRSHQLVVVVGDCPDLGDLSFGCGVHLHIPNLLRAEEAFLEVTWNFYNGGFWIRAFGRGVIVTNKLKHPPLFSERNGYRHVFRIGRWAIEWLNP